MKLLIIIIVLIVGSFSTNAQNPKNDKPQKSVRTSFEVRGVCDMCKERIETAAIYTKGVKYVSWDKKNQMVSIVYNGKKTTVEKIHQSIADAGHDTSKTVAKTEAYSSLPDCCRYRDGVEIH